MRYSRQDFFYLKMVTLYFLPQGIVPSTSFALSFIVFALRTEKIPQTRGVLSSRPVAAENRHFWKSFYPFRRRNAYSVVRNLLFKKCAFQQWLSKPPFSVLPSATVGSFILKISECKCKGLAEVIIYMYIAFFFQYNFVSIPPSSPTFRQVPTRCWRFNGWDGAIKMRILQL